MKDQTIRLILGAILAALLIPQLASGCRYINEQERLREAQKAQAAISHWNNYVQPLRDLCVKKGGWPRVVPMNGHYDTNWQVLCDFPLK